MLLMLQIYHSVNAGLYISSETTGLLIDGIHLGKEVGFSDMPASLFETIRRRQGIFSNLSALVFSHLHPDHFDGERVGQLLREQPFLAAPELKKIPEETAALQQASAGGTSVPRLEYNETTMPATAKNLGRPYAGLANIYTGAFLGWSMHADSIRFSQIGDLSVVFIPKPHDGPEFAAVPNHALVISSKTESWFISADAVLDEQLAYTVLPFSVSGTFRGAFINPLQLASPGGKAFLRALSPEEVFIFHLPFTEDDLYSYHMTAHALCRSCAKLFPRISVPAHMSAVV